MNKTKMVFVGAAVAAVAIIAAVTSAVYACPQTTGVDCYPSPGSGSDRDHAINLQLKDQDQPWGDGVNKTWTALNMAPGHSLAFTGDFVGLRTSVPSLALISCDYQVTKGLPDHMAQQLVLTSCVYGGSLWKIDCLTGNWQIFATGSHPLLQGTNLQWKLADIDHDGAVTFYDLKKSPVPYLPLPDVGVTSDTQFQIGVKFASTAGNDLENDTLNMNMNFTASAWDNSCNSYGVDPKLMQLFFGSQPVVQAPTSTLLASFINPSFFGQSVTFTAMVKAASFGSGTPGGTVTFKDGSTVISGNVPLVGSMASFNISTLAVGSHNITAVYSGDSNFAGSTSNLVIQKVRAKTVCIWPVKPTPCNFGQPVRFTVQIGFPSPGIGNPTGLVTFFDGQNKIGIGSWSGNNAFLNCSLSAGFHNITAVYNGDDNYDGCTSDVVTQTVNKVNSLTTLTSSSNPAKLGSNVIFTAVVSTGAGIPSGSVTFKDGSFTLGTVSLSGSKAVFSTFKLSVGTHSITAVYDGDGNFNGSASSVLPQKIN